MSMQMSIHQIATMLVQKERERHERLGWTAEHDKGHHEQLRAAGHSYSYHASFPKPADQVPDRWPWDTRFWKPETALRDRVRAGALYMAAADAETYPQHRQSAIDLMNAEIDRIVNLLVRVPLKDINLHAILVARGDVKPGVL